MKWESFVLENAAWPALLVDQNGSIRQANAAAVGVFGAVIEGDSCALSAIWSPGNSETPVEFLQRVERSRSVNAPLEFQMKGGGTGRYHGWVCLVSREGQRFFVFQLPTEAGPDAQGGTGKSDAVAGDPVGLEGSLAQKQKLDCALQLARSVALDFNNALTTVLGHTSLVLSRMEPDNPWRASLMEVEKSAAKAAEIAHDLAAFSRQEKDVRVQKASNLNALLQRTVEAFKQGAASRLKWGLQFERRLFSAQFDEAKMQQAFVKILENAVQGTPGEGRISVQSRNIEISEPTRDRTVQLSPGVYVCVEITDTGSGIEPDLLPRVFEPFFSTKGGAHRGLGLAWVYGIVTNHGGGVAISSQPKVGTSVRVYLPATQKIVRDPGASMDDLSGHQVILIVDDEELLLNMGQMILSSFGYRVHTANSGQKALEIFSKADPPVDLVISDLVMPQMSGRELIEHLHRLSPATPVICSSGYIRPAHLEEDETYLQKPFTSQDLLRKVKQALSPSGSD
jgi:two-component system cell cycle sensor histidine kinase/response regulator CckA